MWTTLASAFALIAAKLLQAYWTRTDQTDAARWRVFQEMQGANDLAATWRSAAWGDPERLAKLGVRPDAQGLRLQYPSSPTPGGPDPGAGGAG